VVNILLANGSSFNNWRAGSTTLTPGQTFSTQWSNTFPATGSLVGENRFVLHVEDVTFAPYNQPPYAPSGDEARASCTVTAFAP